MDPDSVKQEYTVKLTYFKKSGKYYSEGEYTSNKQALYKIWEEVREMRKTKMPGLIDPELEFTILVSVPDHPHDLPHLIMGC